MNTNEPLLSTINVRGNFTQGSISGQNIIGNNNLQILYKNCIFRYPDGSTKHGYSWIYTQGARPIIDPLRIFGRIKELERIESLLKDKSALVITGFRGTGKSTLASMLVDRMEESGKFCGIYWRKMDETTDIKDIIGSFFTVIGKPVKELESYKIKDQINLLFNELNKATYLLVLDNFEILLDPQTNKPLKSKVGFSELIESAKENCIISKILFTCWDTLSSERGIRPFTYQTHGLDTSAGILLLRHGGLLNESEAELKKAVKLSGGHPLALILLSQLVIEGADTLSTLLNDNSLWITRKGEVAENIFDKVFNERLSEDERKLLQYLSIFRQPVPAKAIIAIANHSEWSESKVKRVSLNLTRKSLLQKEDENYWEESLISTYAETLLSDKSKLHKLACKYYLSLTLPEHIQKKEILQSLIEAHYHACMAEEYEQAFNIINDNDLAEELNLRGNYAVVIDIYSKMLPEDHFGNESLLKSKEYHGTILGNMGDEYISIGEFRKAIEYYDQAVKIFKETGEILGEGTFLGKRGIAYLNLGEPKKAIECHKQAIETFENKDYNAKGYPRIYQAVEFLIKLAFKNEIEKEKKSSKGIQLRYMGYAYLKTGEPKKAIEYHKQAVKIFKEIGDKKLEGYAFGDLGDTYHSLGDSIKAIEYYEQALTVSREIWNQSLEGETLSNLGGTYLQMGDSIKAIEYYQQALKVSREIWNQSLEGIILSNLGLAYHILGDSIKAIEYYEQSLKIAKELEYSDLIRSCERNLEALKYSKK